MSETADWAAGTPCERHDLSWCTDCRDLAGMRRDESGATVYQSDCTVQTFAEVTGTSYDEAVTALRTVGFVPKKGTPHEGVLDAFRDAGYTVTDVTRRMSILYAQQMSRNGRHFVLCGTKGKKGHAWSITGGKINRPFRVPYRYSMYEVVKSDA